MKPPSSLLLPLVAALAALAAPAAAQEPGAAEAPWFDQLGELAYQLYLNSNVNVVNGLNLTRDQAARLRALAEKAEAKGIRRPEVRGALAADLQSVKDAFVEARRVLMEGREVGADLELKVAKARALESAVLRKGLRFEPGRDSCSRCHAEPSEKGPFAPWAFAEIPDLVRKMMADDHIGIGLQKRDLVTLYLLGQEVDEVLTENQKAVVADFSCCLLPPKNMGDPVRVGQAAVAGWQEEMLEKARKVGPALWPLARRTTLDKVLQGERLKNPGLTDAQAEEIRARVGEVLDRARGLKEMEFALGKAKLCEEMRLGPARSVEGPEALRRFHRAFFLLLPGSKDAYDALIKRLDEAPAAKPRDLEKEPAATKGG
ncbi:MAG: hypothetical protein MUC63_02525 [Planctomycetes bacterium]|jgi:hypothetical protein|nr:hypothetical protein [Planctomycetota bacterium]